MVGRRSQLSPKRYSESDPRVWDEGIRWSWYSMHARSVRYGKVGVYPTWLRGYTGHLDTYEGQLWGTCAWWYSHGAASARGHCIDVVDRWFVYPADFGTCPDDVTKFLIQVHSFKHHHPPTDTTHRYPPSHHPPTMPSPNDETLALMESLGHSRQAGMKALDRFPNDPDRAFGWLMDQVSGSQFCRMTVRANN